MSNDPLPYGSTHISPRAIATIACNATMETYGVVGLASKNLLDGLANVLVKDPAHGIDVHYAEDRIDLDLFVIIAYGTRIKSVAASIAQAVAYHVEKAVGLPVNTVNVHVQGLRIDAGDAGG